MSQPVQNDDLTMRAIVKTSAGPDSVALLEVPRPRTVAAGHALVRVIATGICGTDIHVAHDEYANDPPVIMGHEILGKVEAVGDQAADAWIGATVACETYFAACERCEWCRAGRRNLCPNRLSIGSFKDGGFASVVTVPIINLHRLPESLTGLAGVLSEPLACVTQCLLDPAVINAGDQVLVTGPGAMGQLSAQVARALGGNVTLAGLDKDAERLAVAKTIGLSIETGTLPDDAFDVVIECSGSGMAAASLLRAVKRGGRYVQVGIFGRDVTVPLDLLLYKELTITSGFASTATSWKRAMSLIEQGLVDLAPLVTKEVPISDWEQAFAAAQAGEGIKTVVIPE